MTFTKKFRLACASLLAVCCIGAAAAGFALAASPVAAGAATSNGWEGGGERRGEVTIFDRAVSVISEVNILDLPNRTGVFYMYESDGKEWSGFSFRNGNSGIGYSWIMMENRDGGQYPLSETTFPWHSLCFDGTNSHMILQDNRIFTTSAGTLGGLHGTQNEKFLDGMVPVEIHIGEGTAKSDPSYVKIGGVELTNEDNDTPITQPWTRAQGTSKELVSSMFPDGCYVVINYNIGSDPTHEFALSDVGSITSANASMDHTETQQFGAFSKALTVDLSSAADAFDSGYQLVAKVNGHALPADAVTVSVTDKNHASVTIPQDKLNAIAKDQLTSSTYFTFHVSNGDKDHGYATVSTKIRFEDPPVFKELDKTLAEKKPFTYEFTYSGEENPLENLQLSYSIGSVADTLTKGSDFTVEKDATENKYTITITQSGVDKIFNGHATSTITIALGPHVVRSSVFIDGQITEYGIRFRAGIDYEENTLHIDDFYATATIKKHNPATLSSRIFYEKAVDVSEPIFIEYGTLDPKVDWMLISLMSSPKLSETFSNDTGVAMGNIVSFIMFGGENGVNRHNLQGMQGTFVNGNTTEYGQNTNMKNNVVEIRLGATPQEGYLKVNGEQVGVQFTRCQSDFPEGKAYVGLFFNNTLSFDFTVNTHVNPVVIASPQNDGKYTMDLGKATDFVLDLVNTSGHLTLKDESGKDIPSTQYSFENGKLTVKAEYFTSKPYVKDGQIFIWDTEKLTGTSFKMTYTNSGMGDSLIAFATKGALGDVSFDLGVTNVTGVLQNGETVPADKYTVEGGKFIVKQAALRDEVGAQEFLVSADGNLYPCYVYVDEFENGYALSSGAAATDGTFTLAGVSKVTQAKAYDLTAGFKLGFEFSAIEKYYERGVNKQATCITIRFFDPMSGNSLVVTIFANFADDRITSSNQALYIEYSLYDGEGTKLAGGLDRPIAPNDGNNSASGAHDFEISEKNGGLNLVIAGRPYSMSSSVLSNFNMKAVILSITTEKSTENSSAKAIMGASVSGGGTEAPGTEGEADNGCGSVIFSGYGWTIALAVIVLGAAVVLVACRKRENK